MSRRRRVSGNRFVLCLLLGTIAAAACSGQAELEGDGVDLAPALDPELSVSVQETSTPPAWRPGVNYTIGTRVNYNGVIYECRQAHRSIVSWEPPRTLTLWQRPTPPDLQPWTYQTHYVVGSLVTHEGETWVCKWDHVSQLNWKPGVTPSVWARPNRPPSVVIAAPASGSQHLPGAGVLLRAAVTDPDGPSPFAGQVDWSSDVDGALCEGLTCTTPPLRVGAHLITALATDPRGAVATATVRIIVNTPPAPSILLPPGGAAFMQGQPVSFRGSAGDPEQEIPATVLSWSSHLDGPLGSGAEFTSSALTVGTHRITLTATDDFGAVGTATVAVIVSPLFGPPSALIQDPPHGTSVLAGTPVRLVGLGFDPEDGLLPEESLVWTSDVDGALGTGSVRDVVLSGPADCAGERLHRVTLTVTDSEANTARYEIVLGVTTACP